MSNLTDAVNSGCVGGGCGGGQCGGPGCSPGSCGGSGCSNNPATSNADCLDKVTLEDNGYKGGGAKEALRRQLNKALEDYYNYKCARKTIDNVHYVDTKIPCHEDGAARYQEDTAYRCINGTWHHADAAIVQDKNQKYETQKIQDPLYLTIGGGANPCKEEPIFDQHGCIIGYKPFLIAEGEFGIWNTSEIYPFTKNCGELDQVGDCEYVYGDLAGKNVRLFRTPSVSKQPFFIGGRTGVPNRYEGGALEDDGAYVLMLGLRVDLSAVNLPKNLPKPLCKINPITITYVERTEANKSVIGSGDLINLFLGDISGDEYAVPKIALNSPEYYDVHLNNQNQFFRGGLGEIPVPAYVFHSPDLHLRRPSLDAYRIIIEGEKSGEGFRYGLYDRGEIPPDFYKERQQQKGTRQAINLSVFSKYGNPIVRCVKAMSYVRADSTLSNADRFTYPLLNTYKESCSYIELKPGSGKQPLIHQGSFAPRPNGDQSYVDESFIGDTKNQERILKGAVQYATVTRYIPNQYGSPILQTYIPIGLEIGADKDGNPLTGAQGLVGDSFVGGYSIKRTSYISDKVANVIVSLPIDPDTDSLGRWKPLMKFFYRVLGIKGWGELPVSGNEGNFADFLHLTDRNGVNNNKGSDIYYASLVKTNNFGYFNTDSNLIFRQTESPELGAVHIHRLKGLNRDSAFPWGSKWQQGFLNRFYIPWNKPSGFKKLAFAIALFYFVYVIGGTAIINGLNDMAKSFIGWTSANVVALIIGIIEIIFGIAWIILWATSSLDNKFIASALGIDLQYPDIKHSGPIAGGGSDRAMREGRVRQFENNYHKINHDYSIPNTVEKGFGMGDPYVTCVCPCEKTNKIVHSNRQWQGSHIDSWANFKSNNFLAIDAGLGKISKIFEMFGQLYAHTTDHLVKIDTNRNAIDVSHLGEGKLMIGSMSASGGVIEGVAGLKDPNASEITGMGYIFPDRDARDWYLFNGGGKPESLGDFGVSQFFNENMEFELLKQFPDFNLVDKKIDGGIGYSMGVDHENGYVFLTKLDYTTKGTHTKRKGTDGCLISNPMAVDCNKSWTLTFDLYAKQWVGFEYFTPHLYAWNRFSMYSFNGEAMWRHNAKGVFQKFYGKYYPSMIEVVAIHAATLDSFDYESTIIDTEAYKWKECDYIRNPKITFDKMIVYNSHQNTGEVELFNNNDDLTPVERSRGRLNTANLEFKGRRWHFSEVINKLQNIDELQFDCMCEVKPRTLNKGIIGEIEGNYKFNDNHIAYRFYFSKENQTDIKLFMKNVQTLIDPELEIP